MRRLATIAGACLLLGGACGAAEWTLYACMSTTKNYVVGAKLLDSGVFRQVRSGEWQQVGHPNPFLFALDYDRRDPSRLYAAAGNGIIRLKPGSPSWTILTGSDVTEMRDISIGPDNSIYYGYVAGVRVSSDRGATWREIGDGLPRKYTEAIRAERSQFGVLVAGTEDGIFRTEDNGRTWKRAGGAGWSIMHIEQSPHDPCFWLAATERGGLLASHDCGRTFEASGSLGVGRNLYDIAFDPTTKGRIAVAGWEVGVAVSTDNGATWQLRNKALPSADVWSVAFDPGKPGRLYAGVHEEALYVSEDAGQSWKPDGLPGSIIYRMRFVPEDRP